jgi:hypothetical protein
VYQSTFSDYYELLENWGLEENSNIHVLEETKENYLCSFEYVEA